MTETAVTLKHWSTSEPGHGTASEWAVQSLHSFSYTLGYKQEHIEHLHTSKTGFRLSLQTAALHVISSTLTYKSVKWGEM